MFSIMDHVTILKSPVNLIHSCYYTKIVAEKYVFRYNNNHLAINSRSLY